MDKQIFMFLCLDFGVLLVLVIIKTVLFVRSTRRRSLMRWLYFNNYDLTNSQTEDVRKKRKIQNRLSVIILVLGLVSAAASLIVFKK